MQLDLLNWTPPEGEAMRDYQAQASHTGTEFFERKYDGRNEAIVIPTAGGKSWVIADVAKNVSNPVIVFQPSQEILMQNFQKLRKVGIEDIGIYSAAFGSKSVKPITLATIGSVWKKPHLFKDFDVIVDECDGVNPEESMYKSFFDEINQPVLGLTATPWRLTRGTLSEVIKRRDGGEIKKYTGAQNTMITQTAPRVFHELSHITQIQELYERRFLCPLQYEEGYFDQTKLALNKSGSEFTDASFKRISHNAVRDAYYAARSSKAKHVLIFTGLVEDAHKVAEMLDDNGFSVAVVTGTTPEEKRAAIDANFRAGRIRFVINVGCWTVGYDFPALDHIILARPTNSARLYYQILGRGMRIEDGKEFCLITDLCGNVARFGKVENWEIVDENGWRLKSGDKYLTGVDLKTGEDYFAPKTEAKTKAFDNSRIWQVGKYKDYPLDVVPSHYLKWVVENFQPNLHRKTAMTELEKRGVSV